MKGNEELKGDVIPKGTRVWGPFYMLSQMKKLRIKDATPYVPGS